MSARRTNRKFAKLPDTELSKFVGTTIAGLTGNADLPDPVVNTKELGTLKTTFDNAIVKANKGGSLATAQKNAARAAVVDALNKNGSYVDINCNDDISILLSSGYQPVSTNRAQTVLPAPQILGVENGQSGELRARVKADPTAKSFQGRIKPLGGDFGPTLSFTNSRSILFKGLTAGLTYVMQLYAIGGSTGQSDWSNPASKMAQ